jgi:hypothetical protein
VPGRQLTRTPNHVRYRDIALHKPWRNQNVVELSRAASHWGGKIDTRSATTIIGHTSVLIYHKILLIAPRV